MKWPSLVVRCAGGAAVAAAAVEPICPANISLGAFEFPHLIIPVNASEPGTAPGTSYFGRVSTEITSLLHFDIPAVAVNSSNSSSRGFFTNSTTSSTAAAGESFDEKNCTLIFLFPSVEQVAANSAYTLSGDGQVSFGLLAGPVSMATTYRTKPAIQTDYGIFRLAPGSAYAIANLGECAGGQTVSVQMANAGTTDLVYFQDYGNAPFGLFITMC